MTSETEGRHPLWLSRLETDEYYPIANVQVTELGSGDIVDVRDFDIEAPEAMAFLTIDLPRSDNLGVYGFTGTLPNGTKLTIDRRNGVPMNRRKIVRYGRRARI